MADVHVSPARIVCWRCGRWISQVDAGGLFKLFRERRDRDGDWRKSQSVSNRQWDVARCDSVFPGDKFRSVGRVYDIPEVVRGLAGLLCRRSTFLMEYAGGRRIVRNTAIWWLRARGAIARAKLACGGCFALKSKPDEG